MSYTIIQAITNQYDQVYDCNDYTADHRLLFTDVAVPVKNWEQRIITTTNECPWEDIFRIRWNPFDYTDTEYVIWVDGSIRITGSLIKYITKMQQGNYSFATLSHPHRTTIWDEYIEWIRMRNYPKEKAFKWMAYMEHNGWNPAKYGLYQVNVCVFKNTPIIKDFCATIWKLLHLMDKKYAERLDQTIVSFVLNTKYTDSINIYKLTDAIYTKDSSLLLHGTHPAR